MYVANRRNENGLVEYGFGDWSDPFEDEKGKETRTMITNRGGFFSKKIKYFGAKAEASISEAEL